MKFCFFALILFTFSTFASAACFNFSGNYLHRESKAAMSVVQEGCEKIEFVRTNVIQSFILDNQSRIIYQDPYVTAWVAASVQKYGDEILLKWENHFSPTQIDKKEIWVKKDFWNGKLNLFRGSGKYRSDGQWVWRQVDVWEKQ